MNAKDAYLLKALEQLTERVETLKPVDISGFLSSVDKVKGKDGKTPVKGKDYFTDEEVQDFKKSITPVKGKDYSDGIDGKDGKDGIDGKTPVKGKDYFTDKEIKDFFKQIDSKGFAKKQSLTKLKNAFSNDLDNLAKNVTEFVNKTVTIRDGEDIVNVLESLPNSEKLDPEKGLKNFKEAVQKVQYIGGGGGSNQSGGATSFLQLTDTPASYLGQTGKVVAVNAAENALEFVDAAMSSPWTQNNDDIYYNSGNVGIGIANPAHSLDVAGDINFTGALRANSSAGTTGQVLVSQGAGTPLWQDINTAVGSTAFIQNGNSFGGIATLGTNDAFALNFETNGSTAMTIDSSGRVGIGTTSPQSRLVIQGSTTTDFKVLSTGSGVNGRANFQLGRVSGSDEIGWQFLKNTDDSLSIREIDQSSGSAAVRMEFATGGNVGIGTTDPSARLDIVGSSDQVQFALEANSFQTKSLFEINSNGSSGGDILAVESDGTLNVKGLTRTDELRIDQTPTAETPTATHTAIINFNGTDYKVLCLAT